MLPREILRQIRRLQLRARRAVEDLLGGEYHSVFKGSGIVFDEVRAYQPGDDIRSIDWNVTARMGLPFVKRFIEERELTVVLVVDASGSQHFGSRLQQKREVAAELAAVLAFSAISNSDRVGLVQFTSQVERFIPPRKGSRHVLRLIRDILFHQPREQGTSLRTALQFLNQVLHRRTIVFLLSDFLCEGYERPFEQVARRHDLIAIRITDPAERAFPAVGLVEMQDPETGQIELLDTSSRLFQEGLLARTQARTEALHKGTRRAGCDLIEVSTEGGHLDALMRFFRMREHRQLPRKR